MERARAFLTIEISRVRLEGGDTLAPIVELAAQAGVAPLSMWRAVRQMCRSGVLRSRAGSGIRLAAGAAPADSSGTTCRGRETRRGWRLVYEHLLDSITRAHFEPGARLPAIKELCAQERAGYRCVRTALERLETQEWVTRSGRGYLVRSARPSGGARVLLVLAGHRDGRPYLFSPRTENNLRALQSECVRRGLLSDLCVCDLGGGQYMRARAVDVARVIAAPEYIGAIVWSIAITPPELTRILDGIVGSRKPLSLFDEGSEFDYAPWLNHASSLRVFSTADVLAGRRMAQYLLQLGHHCVAFFSPFHAQPWSRARLEGMRAACGARGAIETFVYDGGDYLPQWYEDQPFGRDLARRIAAEARRTVPPQTYTQLMNMLGGINRAVEMLAMPPRLVALFDTALERARASAWVGANDTIALKCLRHLRGRGIRVPADISVCGFDDSMDGLYERLTSYSFNGHAAVASMVAFLLEPVGRRRAGPRYVPIQGFIVERDSCAPARS